MTNNTVSMIAAIVTNVAVYIASKSPEYGVIGAFIAFLVVDIAQAEEAPASA